MSALYKKLQPKSNEQIFNAYIRVNELREKDESIKLPSVTLSLSNGSNISGNIVHCDTTNRMITVAVASQSYGLSAAFIDFDAVISVTVHEIDLCNEFIEELNNS